MRKVLNKFRLNRQNAKSAKNSNVIEFAPAIPSRSLRLCREHDFSVTEERLTAKDAKNAKNISAFEFWRSLRLGGSTAFFPGFTLIELMVVISIIVLVLAMAVPLVHSLEGNRSLEAAYNGVSAALGHARQTAIYFHAPAGVVFFQDPVTGLQDIGYIAQESFIAQNFSQLITTQSLSPATVPSSQTPGQFYQADNGNVDSRYMDLIPGEEIFALPAGLAVQVSNGNGTLLSKAQFNGTTVTPTPSEQFLRFGVVLFDENGQLVTLPYWIAPAPQTSGSLPFSILANRVNSTAVYLATGSGTAAPGGLDPPATPPGGTGGPWLTLYSHVALCVYDEAAYLGQTASDGTSFADGNSNSVTYYPYFTSTTAAPTPTAKYAEQLWLQQNGQVYVIKPNDGSLLRNQ